MLALDSHTCLMLVGNQYCILLLQVELHKYVPSRKFNAINTNFWKDVLLDTWWILEMQLQCTCVCPERVTVHDSEMVGEFSFWNSLIRFMSMWEQ